MTEKVDQGLMIRAQADGTKKGQAALRAAYKDPPPHPREMIDEANARRAAIIAKHRIAPVEFEGLFSPWGAEIWYMAFDQATRVMSNDLEAMALEGEKIAQERGERPGRFKFGQPPVRDGAQGQEVPIYHEPGYVPPPARKGWGEL